MDDKFINALKTSERLTEEKLDEGKVGDVAKKAALGLGGAVLGAAGTVANGITFGIAGKVGNGIKKGWQAGTDLANRMQANKQRNQTTNASDSSGNDVNANSNDANTNTQQTQQAASVKLNKKQIDAVKPCIEAAALAACTKYLKTVKEPQQFENVLIKNYGFPKDIIKKAIVTATEAKQQAANNKQNKGNEDEQQT